MTTPPRLKPGAAAAALESITDRHLVHGDDRLDESGETPAEMLVYLRKHARRFSPGVRVDDLDDVPVLLLHKVVGDEAGRSVLA